MDFDDRELSVKNRRRHEYREKSKRPNRWIDEYDNILAAKAKNGSGRRKSRYEAGYDDNEEILHAFKGQANVKDLLRVLD